MVEFKIAMLRVTTRGSSTSTILSVHALGGMRLRHQVAKPCIPGMDEMWLRLLPMKRFLQRIFRFIISFAGRIINLYNLHG